MQTPTLFLYRSLFARAPMILPGTPSGRPCALAKTPARTRKHCNFSPFPFGAEGPIIRVFTALFLPGPFTDRAWIDSVYLTPVGLAIDARPLSLTRTLPSVSSIPSLVTPMLAASHNVNIASAVGPLSSIAPFARIISHFQFSQFRLANRRRFLISLFTPARFATGASRRARIPSNKHVCCPFVTHRASPPFLSPPPVIHSISTMKD
jgi:hypothetical protein